MTVNRENAETLASWAPRLGLKQVIATCSAGHVTEKDRVTPEEVQVFQKVMASAGLKVFLYQELPDAIAHGLELVKPGYVLLLAGCQGMDHGARLALEQLYRSRPYLDKETVFRLCRTGWPALSLLLLDLYSSITAGPVSAPADLTFPHIMLNFAAGDDPPSSWSRKVMPPAPRAS